MKTNSLKRSVLAVAVSLGTLAAGQAWAAEQFIPIPSYRVGPYASGGSKYYGGLIIFFLIVEPLGLARLWQIAKEKLRMWPFPH